MARNVRQRQFLQRIAAEVTLASGSAALFGVWTWLTLTGRLARLDTIEPHPYLPPRSVLGQIAEAVSLLTHPFLTLLIIAALTVFSFHARMRRLAIAFAVAAAGVSSLTVLSLLLGRPRPASFDGSISAFGGAYPATHVAAVTILAWVLVTLTRAHRRRHTLVAQWVCVSVVGVATTCVCQWKMGLERPTDIVGGLLLGLAVANLALSVGGVTPILAGWAHLGLPEGSVNKRAAVVLNPTKFTDLSLLRRRVEAEVLAAGWQPTIWLETTPEDPGVKATTQALEAGVDLVLVAGGDGTVRAVSATLAGTDTPMALLPSGTSNLLARNLGVPLDTDAALRLALHGPHMAIDVVRLRTDSVDQRFVVMAGMGLDAKIMNDTSPDLKRVIRSGAYALAAVQNAVPEPFPLTVTIDDGEPVTHQAVMALVGNVGTITGGMTILHDARPDDGVVDLLLASPDRLVDWARFGAQILTGKDQAGFVTHRGRTMVLEAPEPVPFEIDGDAMGQTQRVVVEVEPRALRVVSDHAAKA